MRAMTTAISWGGGAAQLKVCLSKVGEKFVETTEGQVWAVRVDEPLVY